MQRLIGKLVTLWALFGGVLLIAIVGITAVNVLGFTANSFARPFGRNIPGLPGYEDAVGMLVGVAVLSMFPYCQLHKAHAIVDAFMAKAPTRLNRYIDIASGVLVACFSLAMAYMIVLGAIEARSDGVETPVLGWPIWIFMPTAVISCLLWAITALMPKPPTKHAADGT